jgi:hypothetical protein
MKRAIVCLSLLAAFAAAVTGCAMPNEAEFPRLANHTPILRHHNNLPPAEMLMHPGPGVEGPGPGVMLAGFNSPCAGGPGVGGVGGFGGCGVGGVGGGYGLGYGPGSGCTSQVAFMSPEGMSVTWDVNGVGRFDSEPLIAPGRYNFAQGAIYRLKITNIQGRAGVELYPTLELGPATPRTEAYLAHNAIPFQLTEEDLDQVLSGNFVTKVIYLPDPEYQELALAGVETLVSTRLDPGVDPIVEADRRGSIMAIIRIGNKDLELPGTVADSGVINASYEQQAGFIAGGHCGAGGCGPAGCADGSGYNQGMGIPPGFVAGVTAPQYGMPMCGTPIGLPGPPHIPLGIPAGLQQHNIVNKTHMNLPGPTYAMNIKVQQRPGFTYPKPVTHVHIVESNHMWPWWFHQPLANKVECVNGNPGCEGECGDACAEGDCPQQ